MTDFEKAMMEKAGLVKEDFEPKDKVQELENVMLDNDADLFYQIALLTLGITEDELFSEED